MTTTTSIDFPHSAYAVRAEFAETHSLYWERLARPGSWWTGAERVAIATETRTAWDCPLCAAREESLPPAAVSGSHATAGHLLPEPAIEAVHRLVTDASRISKPWLEGLYEQGLSDGQYVELVGTVVAVVSLDSFCLALDVTPHALPESVAGEISQYRPANLDGDTAFMPMLGRDLAGTPEEDLFPGGRAPNVYRAMNLVPDEVRSMLSLSSAHYPGGPGVEESDSVLTRPQMELVAARVSALNECFY